VVLLVAAFGLAFAPGLAARAVQHAQLLVDRPAVARETLHGVPAPLPRLPSVGVSGRDYAYGAASALLAVAIAWLGLYRRRLPDAVSRVAVAAAGPPMHRLRQLHDGVVGEYVTWVVSGAAVLGALFAAFAR
jgi:multicomponent Na+:H+ antiporter subunit D